MVVGAVILATFFSGVIPGLGGSGDSGDGQPAVQVGVTEPSGLAAAGDGQKPEDAGSPEDGTAAPSESADDPPPELIEVVVERDIYGLQQPDGRYRVVPISEVLEAARRATGNEDGIKVRIRRKASAKVVAWSTLESELQDSGISPSAILIPKKLID